MTGVFVSDLHGHSDRYRKLFDLIERERPDGVFLGGDLLPSGLVGTGRDCPPDYIEDVLAGGFASLREHLSEAYPAVFLILGNDDGRACEQAIRARAYPEEEACEEPTGLGRQPAASGARADEAPPNQRALWHYVHGTHARWRSYRVYGYSYCPPSPFALKDWERYDVSRFTDPGCSSPEEGFYSLDVPQHVRRTATIKADLESLFGSTRAFQQSGHAAGRPTTASLDDVIVLFHAPPYDTALDRAALDDTWVDHVPMDVHVGSIAIRRFIEARKPRITLHGHVHEAPRLTGRWQEKLGPTRAFTAAHDGPELAVVRFDPDHPGAATRELL